ncbi:hypothetical protein [Algoriphagus sp. CAU 1675]|uniref:hypothetical protein n=1 Tax=Algoriphagus sp. CAU 1675 TaxID=3032597 RepID=UPI0023DAF0CE|nr:hypothetical protein [Algoriphagus sp. CAU 1675]MDF2156881.1 hypothetical protein [Algoriphagus sp. CAU 1675]
MANWFSKLKEWAASIFYKSSNLEAATATEDLEVTPSLDISRRPGINCPECKTRLTVSIQNLINYEPVICHNCGLELIVDEEKSRSSIESLRKLQHGLDEAAKVRQQGQL